MCNPHQKRLESADNREEIIYELEQMQLETRGDDVFILKRV